MAALYRKHALWGAALLLAACTPAPKPVAEVEPKVKAEVEAVAVPATKPEPAIVSTPAAPPSADLSYFGALRIGAAFGKGPGDEVFVSAGARELFDGDCEYYDEGSLPKGVSMMVIADQIARFETGAEDDPRRRVDAAPIGSPTLPFGIWVGMTVEEAKRRLPAEVVTSPHAYTSPEGTYLTWTDRSDKLALRLETLNGLVTSIYWGKPEAVELIEGCA